MEWTHLPICPPACSLAISSIRFLSPSNAAWMLLLLNIICISCFSTCNAHFCPCLPHTQFWSGSHFECEVLVFYFIPDKMDTEVGMWMFCHCNGLAPVISRVWLCLLRLRWGAKKAVNPYCACHMHFCIWLSCSIFCNKGTEVLLWAWINETFRAPEREKERSEEVV